MLRLALVLSLVTATSAQAPEGAPAPEDDPLRPFVLGSWRARFGPAERWYGPYVAEQRRPTLGIKSLSTSSERIANTGQSRWGLRVGREFPLVRFHPAGRPEDGVQLDGEVGILAQFDRDNSTDNIGWDGFYGVYATWRVGEDVAMRVGAAHDSSHLGDEYIEANPGITRINYTREEWLLGVSWQLAREWRTYAEYGWGYDLRNEQLMEEGRVQGGLEWEASSSPWGGRSHPYAALDVDAFEEDDWEGNVTVQAGVVLPTAAGWSLRFGLEYYDGRAPIGELFQTEERYASLGIWVEL